MGLSGAAVVTGAATGVGLATARRLIQSGARLVLTDTDEQGLDEAVISLRATGGIAHGVIADPGQEDQIAMVIARCVAEYGGIDILVNNAAPLDADALDRDVLTMTVELWDRTMQTDLRSQMLATRYALPHMVQAGHGSVVNVAGISGEAGDVVHVASSAAKAGIIAFTRYVASMYGKEGVRCNAVSPGALTSATEPADQTLLDNYLIERLGGPEDAAAVVAFLASDDAAFVTGQVIRVDGGALSDLPTFS